MRQTAMEVCDREWMEALIQQAPVGQLAWAGADGRLRIAPVNPVWLEGAIYFHGAGEGEKFAALAGNPQVAFGVDQPFSRIPSYWIAKDYACPATQFYQSVHVRGRGAVEGRLEVKAAVLNQLMAKLQPEGGHRPIQPDDPLYAKALQETAVFRVDVEEMTGKRKFGQNKSPEYRRLVMERLAERGEPLDLATRDEIARTLA